MSTTNKQEQMWESLHDPGFRKQLIDEHINVGLAFQIQGLRDRQQLTQTELAKLLGKRQSQVSQWEDPNYGKYTLETLKDYAKAFDVGLLVRFVPFSTLVDWTMNLTGDLIAPPSFSEEQSSRIANQILSAHSTDNFFKEVELYLKSAAAGQYAEKQTGVADAFTA